MTKVVSIFNMKGGVGKTTLTLHLAYDLADRLGKRVLIVDFDPQANASEGLLDAAAYKSHKTNKLTVSDLFSETRSTLSPVAAGAAQPLPDLDELVCRARDFRNAGFVDLAPADIYLSNILERARGSSLDQRLSAVLAGKKSRYDFVLIDCGPTYSVLSNNALRASDHVLIPVVPDSYAAKGIPILLKKIVEYNNNIPVAQQVKVLGIVFMKVADSVIHQTSIRSEILREHRNVFQNSIQLSISYQRAALSSRTVFEIGKVRSGVKQNFQELTDEFMRRV